MTVKSFIVHALRLLQRRSRKRPRNSSQGDVFSTFTTFFSSIQKFPLQMSCCCISLERIGALNFGRLEKGRTTFSRVFISMSMFCYCTINRKNVLYKDALGYCLDITQQQLFTTSAVIKMALQLLVSFLCCSINRKNCAFLRTHQLTGWLSCGNSIYTTIAVIEKALQLLVSFGLMLVH